MFLLDSIMGLREVCNSQLASFRALASLAGTWKAEERGVGTHSHQVPSLGNQEPRAVGVLGLVCHPDMAQESCILFQMSLVACSRSSNSFQLLCFSDCFLHS